jgi:bifunctional DNA-binding transcriptional regulator/antitoxin component of YhaV-PrlF toxin-antitoxin module
MESEKEKKAILAKLKLLEEMRKLHEWIALRPEEADEVERELEEIDSEISDSKADQPGGE